MYCRNCGTKYEKFDNVCPKCHKEKNKGNKFCSECGAKLAFRDTKICPHCGHNLDNIKTRKKEKSKNRTTAALLSCFGGWFGLGRFYLGYMGIGIIQILVSMFTLGIGGIWPFIEGILIIKKKLNKDYYGHTLID